MVLVSTYSKSTVPWELLLLPLDHVRVCHCRWWCSGDRATAQTEKETHWIAPPSSKILLIYKVPSNTSYVCPSSAAIASPIIA